MTGIEHVTLQRGSNGEKDPNDYHLSGVSIREEVEALRIANSANSANSSEPMDIVPELVEEQPYPTNKLPPMIAQAIEDASRIIKTHPALCAATLLSQMAAAAQEHYKVKANPSNPRETPLALFFMTVAHSGVGKSETSRILGKALADKQHEVQLQYKKLKKEFDAEYDIWKARKEQLNNAMKSNAKPKEGQESSEKIAMDYAAHCDKEPRMPRVPFYKVEAITTEKLVNNLCERHPSAIIDTAEGGKIFGSHAVKGENAMGFLAVLNSLWSAEPVSNSTIGRGENTAENAVVSANIMIQPKTLSEAMSRLTNWHDIGLGNRFLLANCESAQKTMRTISKDDDYSATDAIINVNKAVERMFARPPSVHEDGGCNWGLLTFSDAAIDAYIEYHNGVEQRRTEGDLSHSDMQGFANRMGEHAVRLAGVLHCMHAERLESPIEDEIFMSASALVDWYANEQLRYVKSQPTPEQQDAIDLEESLLSNDEVRRSGYIDKSTFMRVAPSRMRKAKVFNAALEILKTRNRVSLPKENGRTRIRINPMLLGAV